MRFNSFDDSFRRAQVVGGFQNRSYNNSNGSCATDETKFNNSNQTVAISIESVDEKNKRSPEFIFSHSHSFPHIYKTQLNSISYFILFKIPWNMSKTQTFSLCPPFWEKIVKNYTKQTKRMFWRKLSQRDWNEKLCVNDFQLNVWINLSLAVRRHAITKMQT